MSNTQETETKEFVAYAGRKPAVSPFGIEVRVEATCVPGEWNIQYKPTRIQMIDGTINFSERNGETLLEAIQETLLCKCADGLLRGFVEVDGEPYQVVGTKTVGISEEFREVRDPEIKPPERGRDQRYERSGTLAYSTENQRTRTGSQTGASGFSMQAASRNSRVI